MINKMQLTFIVVIATIFFAAGCSVPHRGGRVAAGNISPQGPIEQSMNDRGTWMDLGPAKNF